MTWFDEAMSSLIREAKKGMGYGESAFAGVRAIEKERERQYYDEGYKDDHDDRHVQKELIRAAYCYMLAALAPIVLREGEVLPHEAPDAWPWDEEFWKPTYDDPQRMLVKAGALIAAEIDRLERSSDR